MRPRIVLKSGFLFTGLFLCAFSLSDGSAPPPIMLDTIHYFVNDARKAREFFTKHFGMRVLAKPEKNPLQFVEYLELRPGQASIAISPRGPYPGLHQDIPRWKRSPAEALPANRLPPPAYGVHWLALRTENLKFAVQSLEKQGLKIADGDVRIPGEPSAKAAVFWGPERTLVTIVQRSGEHRQSTIYGMDHLLILVRNLEENVRFFQEVHAGKVKHRETDFCRMLVGGHTFILATPPAIGLPATTVRIPDSTRFMPRIEQLGFLYHDPQPAYQSAAIKGYGFSLRPSRLIYHNKPTPYVSAITRTPEGIYCEMYAEDGRSGARTAYVKAQRSPDVAGNKRDK